MSFDSLQQNFVNATGFLYDRSINPPKLLGQCFIVSKSRAVTTAQNVYNYREAPWALQIHFPHPDVMLGVKGVAIHSEFDLREARNYYLSQTGSPLDTPPVLLNDLATLVLDQHVPELQMDKVAELNRALSLPFSSQGVEASGNVRGTELFSVINTILEAQKAGLLTLFDLRNIPIGRLEFGPGFIQKVHYKAMVGEMAFAELVYRKPAEGYAFQPAGTFSWGTVRDVSVPTNQLIQEAYRRTNEIPQMLKYLSSAGVDARFQRAVQNFDPSSASENIRWFVELLWVSLDGYITIDRLPERLAVDTYTVLQAIRELVNKGLVTLLNRATPFPCHGQLGTPLVSHTDFDINPGDPLTAFYLDPLSGAPTWQQGTFFGVSSVLQPKNLLHTIPILPGSSGALVLKNYKLVGVHGGSLPPKPGQDQRLNQMMWIGALLDMSARKLRTATEGGEEEGEGIAGLRTRLETDRSPEAGEKVEKIYCPNCHSINTKYGPCFNCGTEIEAPEPEEIPEDKVGLAVHKAKALQTKYGITNKHLAIVAAVVLLPLMMFYMCGPSTPGPTVTQTPTNVMHANDEAAVKVATEYAGFKASPPPGYWYEDTTERTKPALSFSLKSQRANQDVLFVVYDDMTPTKNLVDFLGKPAYMDVRSAGAQPEKVDENYRIIGTGDLHYHVGRYVTPKETQRLVLVGAYASPVKDKSILIIGTSLNEDNIYDYQSTLWLVDHMASEFTEKGNKERMAKAGTTTGTDATTTGEDIKTGESTEASEADIRSFLAKVQDDVQSKLQLPDEVSDERKKKKSRKLKVKLSVTIDEEGKITKLDIGEPSEVESVTNAVLKAVNASAPFEKAPKTKEGKLSFNVRLNMEKITVDRA
ncbi:MAG TPA: TonB C-terminal domain-containing protein [Candidatus Obscuribacterales bacterium]